MKMLSIGLGLLLLLAACAQEKQEQPAAKVVKKAAVSEMDHLVEAYLELKNALVASDSEEAAEQATALLEKVETAKSSEIAGKLLSSSKKVVAAADLEAQREAFFDLSNDFIEVVKSSEDINNTIYVQYCPMAFDNSGGDWLSDSEKILNPYFGDRMLRCGTVKETLAAK